VKGIEIRPLLRRGRRQNRRALPSFTRRRREDRRALHQAGGGGQRGIRIVYLRADGGAVPLFEDKVDWGAHLLLSPDGKHLAFGMKEIHENLWVLEGALD
jgi:hypothetical protein